MKKISKTDEQLLPAHTLARYGGDVLLRFNISTEQEAKSLAEASDTLLLDVWEFAADWVDIRLAQELVPSLLGLLPQSLQRSHVPLLRERELALTFRCVEDADRIAITAPRLRRPTRQRRPGDGRAVAPTAPHRR